MPLAATSAAPAASAAQRLIKRRALDTSIILHFDYDCFYASVIENQNPELNLKSKPLAVQQKQIVVTCNYEARRRGLNKLQLIKDAKKICPDVVIVLGEDLTRFRNVSKELYGFLKSFSWNSRCERLGFDEVFMDVSDIIDYNVGVLNPNSLSDSFFCLSKHDPTAGFAFDASMVAGHTYPETPSDTRDAPLDSLRLRLHLASHLAKHLKDKLESEKGYTCTAGVCTNKLLSKLVGNLHKPNGQTTLLPPYASDDSSDNVSKFMDEHEVRKVPGIGFKIAQKLRAYVLQKQTELNTTNVYNAPKENVLVGDVRKYPGIGPETLEKILGGPGAPAAIGAKVFGLLHGYDDTEVGMARELPKQISLEDSYRRLNNLDDVAKELQMLARSLIRRMHVDLMEDEDDQQVGDAAISDPETVHVVAKRWVAFPKTLRLSTRPRPPPVPDGSRNRSFARISRSAPFPTFVFNLNESVDAVTERLVNESLMPLFRRIHPERSGWDLSLVNVAATNIADAASEKGGVGRDIGKMFKRQDHIQKQQRDEESPDPMEVEELPAEQSKPVVLAELRSGSEDFPTPSQEVNLLPDDDRWKSEVEDEDVMDDDSYRCEECGAVMPLFAMGAHGRWHSQN